MSSGPAAPGVSVSVAGGATPSVGDMVTLDCNITPGTPASPQTISWYRAGALVPGEFMATYTFASTAADDGVTYECRVDNGMVGSGSLVLALMPLSKFEAVDVDSIFFV